MKNIRETNLYNKQERDIYYFGSKSIDLKEKIVSMLKE